MNSRFSNPFFVLAALLTLPAAAHAVPIVLQPGASFVIFDTGGDLNPGINGGYFLGGLEVAPGGGTVYVAAGDGGVGAITSSLTLISSTGPGTAVIDPAGPRPLSYASRGNDLTNLGGAYYVAANDIAAPAPTPGVYGMTYGAAGFATFAAGPAAPGAAGFPIWETSGLTFEAGGTVARVTTDVPPFDAGQHTVAAGAAASTLFVSTGVPPVGYDTPADDHVIAGAKNLVATDASQTLFDVTGGPGTVVPFANIPVLLGGAIVGVGSRATVDPITGDIFYALGAGGTDIVRVKADGSAASIFATGFVGGVRDIDFGPSILGPGPFSLYATEVTPAGLGTIYEFDIVPEPSSFVLAAGGLLSLAWLIRRRRRA